RRKIFQIFYRRGSELERRRKGTGLGLYIVHTLVRRMKGSIDVLDRIDGKSGCVFQVELPGPVSDHSLMERSEPPLTARATQAAETLS
ncbi:MAG: ATP-binding protein, partial [Planctomycetaceae bacterium]|nr:ATP-binding protein [Planctomycetaceae bacterium]